MQQLLLAACAASAWYMTGLIWFVQVVHYPLFAGVGSESFPEYHRIHVRRTTWVVLAPMLVELLSAIGLVIDPPATAGRVLPWIGLFATLLCWLSTAFVQVPLHERLARASDRGLMVRLVRTNLARALGWTAHALITLAMMPGFSRGT
ncbi:MAG: hypothetical protein U0790_16470 [Isosphaeraceae bacterium]